MTAENQPEVLARIKLAEDDKQRIESYVDESYIYFFPDRPQLSGAMDKRGSSKSLGWAQADIFDHTGMQAAADFVSTFNDLHTPKSTLWASFEPTDAIAELERNSRAKQDFEGELKRHTDAVHEEIRRSSYFEAAQSSWGDYAITAQAVEIHGARGGNPPWVEYVPLKELLIEPGPFGGIDGRWRKRSIEQRHLPMAYPFVAKRGASHQDLRQWWASALNQRDLSNTDSVEITHGYRRIWQEDPVEAWLYEIVVSKQGAMGGGKRIFHRIVRGPGSCGLMVNRFQSISPSAWGPGPAALALPPARALDELKFIMMSAMAKIANPPWAIRASGAENTDVVLEPGTILHFSDEFDATELVSGRDLREPLFAIEDMRADVRKAFYVDEPQPLAGDGDVIHRSAAQYFDEKARLARRIELPQGGIYKDWVVPILQRFHHIMSLRGDLQPVTLNDRIVKVRARSPLSRGADLEKVNIAQQVLAAAHGVMPEHIASALDGHSTLLNIKRALGDTIIDVVDEETFNKNITAQLAAGPGGEFEGLSQQLGAAA